MTMLIKPTDEQRAFASRVCDLLNTRTYDDAGALAQLLAEREHALREENARLRGAVSRIYADYEDTQIDGLRKILDADPGESLAAAAQKWTDEAMAMKAERDAAIARVQRVEEVLALNDVTLRHARERAEKAEASLAVVKRERDEANEAIEVDADERATIAALTKQVEVLRGALRSAAGALGDVHDSEDEHGVPSTFVWAKNRAREAERAARAALASTPAPAKGDDVTPTTEGGAK